MKFVKCESCGAKIPKDVRCEFASYIRTIGGERFIFCCARCADEYEKRQKTGQRKKA
jgi:RNA polymerase-binding transcription factor DksA